MHPVEEGFQTEGLDSVDAWVNGCAKASSSFFSSNIDRPATRGEEIAAYLKVHFCDNYVILDDCDEMLRDQWPHLVLVNDEVGLTEADVEKAVGILNQTQDK